jgi:hypothetical protein
MFPVAGGNHLTADQMAVQSEVDPGALGGADGCPRCVAGS